jgi:hypothetical protein
VVCDVYMTVWTTLTGTTIQTVETGELQEQIIQDITTNHSVIERTKVCPSDSFPFTGVLYDVYVRTHRYVYTVHILHTQTHDISADDI